MGICCAKQSLKEKSQPLLNPNLNQSDESHLFNEKINLDDPQTNTNTTNIEISPQTSPINQPTNIKTTNKYTPTKISTNIENNENVSKNIIKNVSENNHTTQTNETTADIENINTKIKKKTSIDMNEFNESKKKFDDWKKSKENISNINENDIKNDENNDNLTKINKNKIKKPGKVIKIKIKSIGIEYPDIIVKIMDDLNILFLKKMIEKTTPDKIDVNRQRLIYKGRQLKKDNRLIRKYKINDGDTMMLVRSRNKKDVGGGGGGGGKKKGGRDRSMTYQVDSPDGFGFDRNSVVNGFSGGKMKRQRSVTPEPV